MVTPMVTETEIRQMARVEALRVHAQLFAPKRRRVLDEARKANVETKRLVFEMTAENIGPTEIGNLLGMSKQQVNQTLRQKPPAKAG